MNNENFHPVQTVPPLAHALHHWDEEKKLLSYEYNGEDILSMQIEESEDLLDYYENLDNLFDLAIEQGIIGSKS